MQTSPRIPEARRRGPNGRFLPRGEDATQVEDASQGEDATRREDLEHTVTELADIEPAADEDSTPELPEDRFLNRELSWLDFNARVLALAEDPSTPLLERAKFLAIFASNLDEFYMVRVAGLQRRLSTGLPVEGTDDLTPREQLARIADQTAEHGGELLQLGPAPDEGAQLGGKIVDGGALRTELGEDPLEPGSVTARDHERRDTRVPD